MCKNYINKNELVVQKINITKLSNTKKINEGNVNNIIIMLVAHNEDLGFNSQHGPWMFTMVKKLKDKLTT